MKRRRLLRRGLWLLWLSPALLPGLLATAWWHSYQRLTDEILIAELTFEPQGPQRFEARLRSGAGCRVGRYLLLGDQWRLDARFLKWKPWANLLGLDARYRLERLEGRYGEVAEQNRRPRRAYALADEPVLDLVRVAEGLGDYNVLLDARYGSSTYETIDPDRIYQVFRTQSGIITRSFPRPAARLQAGRTRIEIRHACGGEAGPWGAAARWLDRTLGRLLEERDDDRTG